MTPAFDSTSTVSVEELKPLFLTISPVLMSFTYAPSFGGLNFISVSTLGQNPLRSQDKCLMRVFTTEGQLRMNEPDSFAAVRWIFTGC